jgi:hypothetical protein
MPNIGTGSDQGCTGTDQQQVDPTATPGREPLVGGDVVEHGWQRDLRVLAETLCLSADGLARQFARGTGPRGREAVRPVHLRGLLPSDTPRILQAVPSGLPRSMRRATPSTARSEPARMEEDVTLAGLNLQALLPSAEVLRRRWA